MAKRVVDDSDEESYGPVKKETHNDFRTHHLYGRIEKSLKFKKASETQISRLAVMEPSDGLNTEN